MSQSKLAQLKRMTTIVADTGDIQSIERYKPTDATTNPSLIYAAAQMPQYTHLVEEALSYGREKAHSAPEQTELTLEKITVNFGREILKIVPGRVSTEVDARLSFDAKKSVEKGRHLIKLYEQAGIPRERILIKLASTWEGIQAAKVLEKEGIHCNMTLMFSLAQAIAAADVGATLISPFVGRILDWYKKAEGVSGYAPEQDPGVLSVTEIYHYYKKFGYSTEVMGASFRNKEEILELAGCDLLTISPQLLKELEEAQGSVPQKLNSETAKKASIQRLEMTETHFRWMLNENAMATEKLAEGIRNFTKDLLKLEQFIEAKEALAPRA